MSNLVRKEIEITAFKSVYYFEHGTEFYHEPEQHNFWEIVYVDKGEIIAITDGIGISYCITRISAHSKRLPLFSISSSVTNAFAPTSRII